MIRLLLYEYEIQHINISYAPLKMDILLFLCGQEPGTDKRLENTGCIMYNLFEFQESQQRVNLKEVR